MYYKYYNNSTDFNDWESLSLWQVEEQHTGYLFVKHFLVIIVLISIFCTLHAITLGYEINQLKVIPLSLLLSRYLFPWAINNSGVFWLMACVWQATTFLVAEYLFNYSVLGRLLHWYMYKGFWMIHIKERIIT